MLHNNKTMSAEQFADSLARSLEKRERLLKLMSMNHYDMEANSRMENLVAFKTVYGNSMRTVTSCLQKFFPRMTAGDIQEFIYAFFPFLFGVYPYTVVTDKQKEAMEKPTQIMFFYHLRNHKIHCPKAVAGHGTIIG